jgi:leucyl/phenylalanyl-tRNA--protein transferase
MISLLDPQDSSRFPDPESAETEPNGLLAVGGDLSPQRLLSAYRKGIFPWFSDDQPILWWSPDPRTVLFPEQLHLSRSLRKQLRRCGYRICFDQAFAQVIDACAEPRRNAVDTWITPAMRQAYLRLHRQGMAHCVEVWQGSDLLGGLYGVGIGQVFFGESMFSRASNASKIALAGLVYQLRQWGFRLIDCQVHTDHLISLGAEEIPRRQFNRYLDRWCPEENSAPSWRGIQLAADEISPAGATPHPATSRSHPPVE